MDVREKLIDLKPCPFCGGELRRGCVWCVIITTHLVEQYDFYSRGEMRKDREYIDSEKKGSEEE